ncbi:hypothetical protein KO516_21535 [Citreicella sp. C3M06]|uniref:hypothetical protein n=1 Tax=Citreicella sp. C3M06 TaxID=2841564 RepID=UPI001C09C4E0|nr:hypothetical protein [Citreicella sp. C3M06]MBU2963359.1 hypothetical protein [Citreicella sp. C3M06]
MTTPTQILRARLSRAHEQFEALQRATAGRWLPASLARQIATAGIEATTIRCDECRQPEGAAHLPWCPDKE